MRSVHAGEVKEHKSHRVTRQLPIRPTDSCRAIPTGPVGRLRKVLSPDRDQTGGVAGKNFAIQVSSLNRSVRGPGRRRWRCHRVR